MKGKILLLKSLKEKTPSLIIGKLKANFITLIKDALKTTCS
jgi:hypothetical protein